MTVLQKLVIYGTTKINRWRFNSMFNLEAFYEKKYTRPFVIDRNQNETIPNPKFLDIQEQNQKNKS